MFKYPSRKIRTFCLSHCLNVMLRLADGSKHGQYLGGGVCGDCVGGGDDGVFDHAAGIIRLERF